MDSFEGWQPADLHTPNDLTDVVVWSRGLDLQLPFSSQSLKDVLSSVDQLALSAWAAELEAQKAPQPEDFPARAALLRRVLALCIDSSRSDKGPERAEANDLGPERTETSDLGLQVKTTRSMQNAREPLEFVAAPLLMRVNRVHVLSTRAGECLKHSGCMTGLLVALSALLLWVTVFKPGAELIPREGPLQLKMPDGQVHDMRTIRQGLLAWVLEFVGFPLFWSLMLHYMNKDLFFKVLFSFDAGMILACFMVSEFAKTYNRCTLWGRHGYYDTTWMVCDAVRFFLVVMPCGVAVSTMDSWKVTSTSRGLSRSRLKILLSALATCYFTLSLYGTYQGISSHRWSDVRTYIGPFSFVPRNLFRASEMQKVIFLSKAMFKYMLGSPFAFIRPSYVSRMTLSPSPSSVPCRQTSGDAQSGSSSDGSEGSDATTETDH